MGKTSCLFTMVVTVLFSILISAAASAGDLAKVNGKAITDKDFNAALSGATEPQRQQIMKDMSNKRQLLSSLVDQEVLTQAGERERLDQDAEYKQALEAFHRQYLANKVLQKNLQSKLTEAAAKKYFSANKSKYNTDEVHVQHILLEDEATAREVLQKARAKGTDFQALAEKLSKDPSAKDNRGDLGTVTHDSPFVAEFKDAAFTGREGEIIGPIKTAYGYHLIKIVKKTFGHPLNYDEVELRVKSDMRQDMITSFIARLRAEAKIQVNEAELKGLK